MGHRPPLQFRCWEEGPDLCYRLPGRMFSIAGLTGFVWALAVAIMTPWLLPQLQTPLVVALGLFVGSVGSVCLWVASGRTELRLGRGRLERCQALGRLRLGRVS